MRRLIRGIDTINALVGLTMGIVSLFVMLSVIYEVVSRYFFNAPTLWSMEVNQYLFCAITLLGGGYCLLRDGHVRVDVLYPKLSPRGQAISDFCCFPLALLFCGFLIWFGWQETWDSIVGHRLSDSVIALPLWPVWLVVPAGGLLLGMQVISRLLRRVEDMRSSCEKND